MVNFLVISFLALVALIGSTTIIIIGKVYSSFLKDLFSVSFSFKRNLKCNQESNFKPKLTSLVAEGGHSKIFKANFHGRSVAMKYIPLVTNYEAIINTNATVMVAMNSIIRESFSTPNLT